jgi:hypothetical protein
MVEEAAWIHASYRILDCGNKDITTQMRFNRQGTAVGAAYCFTGEKGPPAIEG